MVLLMGGISTAVVSSLSIIAFLGRFVGTFSVSLDTGNVGLTLSRDDAFTVPTSFLKTETLPEFQEYTYRDFSKIGDDQIDSDATDINLGATAYNDDGTIKNLNFFKYTFFVKNEGNIAADYDLKVNITKNVPSDDGRYLDTLLRVLVYQNDADKENNHDFSVYAKRSETPNPTYGYEEGETTYKEYISYSEPSKAIQHGDQFPGFAEMFEDANTIATIPVRNFQKDDAKRYTIVAWLEGEDQQAKGNPPEGGNLKLGVTINAYENQ